MASKHICPDCGCTRFQVTAHVTQGWLVDEVGEFIACSAECDEVIHEPDDDDVWTCDNCGAEAIIVKEEMEEYPNA